MLCSFHNLVDLKYFGVYAIRPHSSSYLVRLASRFALGSVYGKTFPVLREDGEHYLRSPFLMRVACG